LRNYSSKIAAIVWKDVAAELRTKEAVSSMFVFALLTIVIFNFALDLTPVNTKDVAPGILWVTFTFAGVLGLNRSFLREKDQGCLEGLMMTPVDRSAIYFGKLLANWLFITVIEAISLPLFGIFFNLPILQPMILPITLLGTLGFTAVGTIFAAMAVNTRLRDVLLPIMLFPIVVPVVIAAVKSTGAVLNGRPLSEFSHWLQLMLAFDALFVATSFMLFEHVLEE
jgi:heme exporter protein B